MPGNGLVVIPPETFLTHRDAIHQGLYTHPSSVVRSLFWGRLGALLRYTPHAVHRALDFGCGDGALLPSLARIHHRVVGLDLDVRGAARIVAHYALRNVSLVQADGMALPFTDGEFDLVVATEVLEHVLSPGEAAVEIRRVLKGGGHLLVSAPTENFVYGLARRASGFARPADHYGNARVILRALADAFAIEGRRYYPLNWGRVGGFLLLRARKRDAADTS